MRFPTIRYVLPAKPQISIPAVWSEPLLVAWVFYDYQATDWTAFGVSKLKSRLHRLVWVYTCQNIKLLEISCRSSNELPSGHTGYLSPGKTWWYYQCFPVVYHWYITGFQWYYQWSPLSSDSGFHWYTSGFENLVLLPVVSSGITVEISGKIWWITMEITGITSV